MALTGLFILIIISLAYRYNFRWSSQRTKVVISFTLSVWLFSFLLALIILLLSIIIEHTPDFSTVLFYFLFYILPSVVFGLLLTLPTILFHLIMNYLIIKGSIKKERKWIYAVVSGLMGILNLITISKMDTEISLSPLFKYKEPLYIPAIMFGVLFIGTLISVWKLKRTTK